MELEKNGFAPDSIVASLKEKLNVDEVQHLATEHSERFLINGASRRRQISGDAAVGIITTSAFAVGVLLISRNRTFTRDFEAALFGEILGISDTDLIVTAVALAAVGLALFAFWKQLVFTTFDQAVAGAYGVPVRTVEGVFSLALAATVIASLQVLGVTLIAAALVIPPVAARLLTDSFSRMFAIAVLLGTLTGFFGAYLSWFVDSSSGATIVLSVSCAIPSPGGEPNSLKT